MIFIFNFSASLLFLNYQLGSDSRH